MNSKVVPDPGIDSQQCHQAEKDQCNGFYPIPKVLFALLFFLVWSFFGLFHFVFLPETIDLVADESKRQNIASHYCRAIVLKLIRSEQRKD